MSTTIKTGNWDTIKTFILSAKEAGVTVEPKKAWIKLTNGNKVRVYVQNPNKGETSRYIHLTGHGYDGTLAGEDVSAHPAVNMDVENGGVAFEIDCQAPGGLELAARVMELLPTLQAQAKPRTARGSKAALPPIDVAGELGLA